MAFLPDSNLWIFLLKNPGGKLDAKVRSQPVQDIFLCAVVKAELWHGAEKYGNRERRRAADIFRLPFAAGRRNRRLGAPALVVAGGAGGPRLAGRDFYIELPDGCGEPDFSLRALSLCRQWNSSRALQRRNDGPRLEGQEKLRWAGVKWAGGSGRKRSRRMETARRENRFTTSFRRPCGGVGSNY